jgi:hypothetical protein
VAVSTPLFPFRHEAPGHRSPRAATQDARRRIGIDFDNTIIRYDDLFFAAARERHLISESVRDKRAIRDAIRLLPDGELEWQRLQGYVYGRGISSAVMFDGLDRFLRRCRAEDCPVLIVSHKTRYGHFDEQQISLRDAALSWMTSRGFFDNAGYGIPTEHVFFETTRTEKVRRIADLACTHFIDDLEEVLGHPGFPPSTMRILFGQEALVACCLPYVACPTWQHVEEAVFGDNN